MLNRTIHHQTIEKVVKEIDRGLLIKAQEILLKEASFQPHSSKRIKIKTYEKMKVFIRDGFVDRYSGKPLIFPPVLRLISTIFPEIFPYHKNWKASDCHPAYWQLMPTVDHLVPLARGGENSIENLMTTSQLHNSAKANWLLEELGWQLHPPGKLNDWDGLYRWFLDYSSRNPEILQDKYFREWHKAAVDLL